ARQPPGVVVYLELFAAYSPWAAGPHSSGLARSAVDRGRPELSAVVRSVSAGSGQRRIGGIGWSRRGAYIHCLVFLGSALRRTFAAPGDVPQQKPVGSFRPLDVIGLCAVRHIVLCALALARRLWHDAA